MAQTQLKRHPVRGALWGVILGLGVLVLLTFVWPVIGLDDWKVVVVKAAVVVVATMAFGVLWGLFAPAKKPKGTPPVEAAPPAPTAETPPPAPADEPAPPPAEG